MGDVSSTHLELHIDYHPNQLCREQIEGMSNYYVSTLQAMASNPGGRYESFAPLSESETQRLLVEWNATAEDYPRDESVSALFEEQVRRRPDAIALEFEGKELSYTQLDGRAEHLSRQLRAMGLAREELVGICLERSPEMIVALLGILKAGGAYVPLDPTYPAERLAFMATDANLRLLLTQRSLLNLLSDSRAQLLCIDEILAPVVGGDPVQQKQNELSGGARTLSPLRPKDPGDLAYVIYTSGSTGKPKGVQVKQRSVVNLLTSVARKTAFSDKENLVAVTTLSFDIASLEIFLPLITGARLTLANGE